MNRTLLIQIRQFRCVVLLLFVAALPTRAIAESYPQNDIHFICAFPPGSGAARTYWCAILPNGCDR